MPTIKDVAREAGVSIATVSYVVNNKDIAISEDTRRVVLEAIERIGYTPNVTARNLKSSQTRLIGYAWHDVPLDQVNSVLDRFTYFLARAAEAAGYHILTFTDPARDDLSIYDDLIRTHRVDAFVLASTRRDDPRIRFLLDHGFPFVSWGRSNSEWEFPWVDTDGRQGVYDAIQYLVSVGHEKIAMIAWPEESISGSFRAQGYLDALHDADIPPREDYLWRGEHSEQTGRDALAYWWRLPPADRPTAIMAITDLGAIGVYNEAERLGISLGKELSVIGFDDLPLVQYLRPALTSVRQPVLEISQVVFDMLGALLNGLTPNPRHMLCAPRLIKRASSGPVRS